ncbi:hillarin isoform X2 [Condylostylus longicornis]|uniref:hillarin isoform X2 n=1 Tax=Condylostylus longicornis TaxID=2530218 RepID=UPI00244E570F|nr:hillarin isoform X2 [Condylostylus longicornis]
MYRPNFYESKCLRCNEIVYQVDRVGPLKDFTFFHSGCFKCVHCGTKLTLKTYYNNQHRQEDKEVYCSSHVPKSGPGHLDQTSVGIRQALNVPRSSKYVNEQIRGSRTEIDGQPRQSTPNGYSSGGGNRDISSPSQIDSDYKYGRFDASALHIAHALKQTEIQKAYNKRREKPIDFYLAREEQARLEMKHRKEEDDLYRKFARKREEEDRKIQSEIQDEWERELQRLTHRFEKELATSRRNRDEQNILTLRHERQKEDLEKNMTLRRTKKKESLTRKMLEHERSETAALVDRQSSEMLELISARRSEYMQNESIFLDDDFPEEAIISMAEYPHTPPKPTPPTVSKFQIYTDPIEFEDVDRIAISVAQEDQKTFTDLVRQLVGRSTSDIEKARTIFRWITVKNLNAMHFDDDLRGDTPMGLLRGIKYGTESYHVLFKRLCSYAGLHCVVIKGYSKSAGYQPGVKFQDSRFRNSWNAVYVAGAWRFVQCNWGARHLVNAKEAPKTGRGKNDSLRYEYDDHYFLTDPREFIYEFFPLQEEWQLLKRPISLKEFENLPFVRSLFFRYGLHFADEGYGAVVYTDDTGAATVRIAMPSDMQSCLIFHYNLKFYDSEEDSFDGVSLKRFVMQSVIGNIVAFRVHAPCSGAFLLDIFANAVTPQEYLTGEPMKFKSVCKFKICCEVLETVMVPLPDCASGEWGPTKATRLFGLIPITHQEPLIFANRGVDIQFRMSRLLTDFMATLHKNGIEEKKLSKYVTHNVSDEVVTFTINFPEEGQYGLDIYTREVGMHHNHNSLNEKHLLTHCCKYLINSKKFN